MYCLYKNIFYFCTTNETERHLDSLTAGFSLDSLTP